MMLDINGRVISWKTNVNPGRIATVELELEYTKEEIAYLVEKLQESHTQPRNFFNRSMYDLRT